MLMHQFTRTDDSCKSWTISRKYSALRRAINLVLGKSENQQKDKQTNSNLAFVGQDHRLPVNFNLVSNLFTEIDFSVKQP